MILGTETEAWKFLVLTVTKHCEDWASIHWVKQNHLLTELNTASSLVTALVIQRYIIQTIYRVDIGQIVSYRYRQEKYRNFDISLSFRYRLNIGETTSMLSIYFLFCR